MKQLSIFLRHNGFILLGVLLGSIAGYFYWDTVGCYWGLSAYSGVWWSNCLYGGVAGGFIMALCKGRF